MKHYTLPRPVRLFLLYIGPSVYIQRDIARLIDETQLLAFRHGYTAGLEEQPSQ